MKRFTPPEARSAPADDGRERAGSSEGVEACGARSTDSAPGTRAFTELGGVPPSQPPPVPLAFRLNQPEESCPHKSGGARPCTEIWSRIEPGVVA